MTLIRGSRTRRLPGMAAAAFLAVCVSVGLATASPAPARAASAGAASAGAASAHSAAARSAADSSSCPWLNQSLPVSQRLKMLMAKMTLADKINMVTGAGTSQPYVFYISAIPGLCIPAMGEEDGPVGVGDGLTGVTQLPSAVSLAATWDPALASQYGKVVGSEEHGKGAMVNLGPTVNIDRDPRWGRSFEAYTEDPYLNAALTVSDIDGVQSTGEMAQVKHYAVYNQETSRNTAADDAIISQRAEHEIYLPAFWAATQQAKASSVMCAYSSINGQYACENDYLLHTTLDQNWAFPGFVTSDYGATHSTVGSANAGNDQEMPSAVFYGPALTGRRAVRPGRHGHAEWHGVPHPDRAVPVQRVQQPAHRHHQHDRHHRGPSGHLDRGRRGRHGPAQEQRQHAAAEGQRRRIGRGDRSGGIGGAGVHRGRQRLRHRPVAGHPAAGHPGRRRVGHHRLVHPGPADRHGADAHPQLRAQPGLRVHRVRRDLHRHAHRPGDRDLRAGLPESRQLHDHQPVPGRQDHPGQPGDPAGVHLLGRRRPEGRPDLPAPAERGRPVRQPELGHPVRPGARHQRGGRRGQVGVDPRSSWCPTTPSRRPPTGPA